MKKESAERDLRTVMAPYLLVARLNREAYRKFALTLSQISLLIRIDADPGIQAHSLCEIVGITRATGSVSLKNLLAMGLIKKDASRTDKRKYLLSLTSAGAETMQKVYDELSVWLAYRTANVLVTGAA